MELKRGPRGSLVLEDVRLLFRNFRGEGGQYNREGDRNFYVLIDNPEIRDILLTEGWNLKTLKPRPDDEGEPNSILKVKVNYEGNKPPRVILRTTRGNTVLDKDTVQAVDFADIIGVDVTIRPYDWTVQEKTGRTAYLQTTYITIAEDPLDVKYADDVELDEEDLVDVR